MKACAWGRNVNAISYYHILQKTAKIEYSYLFLKSLFVLSGNIIASDCKGQVTCHLKIMYFQICLNISLHNRQSITSAVMPCRTDYFWEVEKVNK